MKVGVFTSRDLNRAGGTANRINGLTQHLHECGCEVALFSFFPVSEALKGKVRHIPVKQSYFFFELSHLYAAYPKMCPGKFLVPALRPATDILREKIDVLHAHKHPQGFVGLAIRHRLRVPMLFDVHGVLTLQEEDNIGTWEDRFWFHVNLKAEYNLFKYADGLAATSHRMKEYLVEHFDVLKENVYVLPDGVNKEFFRKKTAEEEMEALRRANGLHGKKVILFAGSFKELGGIRDLLEAFRMVRAREKDVVLLMIGCGNLLPFAEQFKKNHRMDNLILKGYLPISELPKYQSVADILVVPEKRSTYNDLVPHIKLLECLASGKATVATRLACVSDIITHKQNGILVEPSNPESLAEGMRLLLHDGQLREAIGKNAPGSIPEEYTWKHSSQMAVAAYEDLIQKHGRRNGRNN